MGVMNQQNPMAAIMAALGIDPSMNPQNFGGFEVDEMQQAEPMRPEQNMGTQSNEGFNIDIGELIKLFL